MNLLEYKELTLLFYCEPFLRWKDETLFFKEFPDNELIYVIMDGLLKSYNENTDLNDAIQNAIQFTSIADSHYYKNEKNLVIAFLSEYTNLYRPIIEKNITKFSKVSNIFTKMNLRKNYILVNICGIKNENYGKSYTTKLSKSNTDIRGTSDAYRENSIRR